MFSKPLLYLFSKIIVLFTCVIFFLKQSGLIVSETFDRGWLVWSDNPVLYSVDLAYLAIFTLTFACIFLLEYLMSIRKTSIRKVSISKVPITNITIVLSMIVCLFLDLDSFFPLLILLGIHFIDQVLHQRFYQFTFFLVLILWLLYPPSFLSGLITGLLLLFILFAREAVAKLQLYFRRYEEQRELVSELNKKIIDIKGLMNTVKNTVSMEERNRIAARIHDQIGHGISGSIIMLEAVNLTMDSNPQKAKESLQKAINNLREGVDDIRSALREERAGHALIGKSDVVAMLQEFKVSYSIDTELKVVGDLSVITMELWSCIHDNLKECLTNVLKHSKGKFFILEINVFHKIIKVEYRDNGKGCDSFYKGLGLDAIEERTVRCGGKCFFKSEENGFMVTNIFTYQ